MYGVQVAEKQRWCYSASIPISNKTFEEHDIASWLCAKTTAAKLNGDICGALTPAGKINSYNPEQYTISKVMEATERGRYWVDKADPKSHANEWHSMDGKDGKDRAINRCSFHGFTYIRNSYYKITKLVCVLLCVFCVLLLTLRQH